MMLRLPKLITKTLSFKLSLLVLIALATLLTVSLIIMFHFSRKVVKEETLHTATQTLEAVSQQIDNVLLSVEQSSGNIYWKMLNHFGQPEKMEVYRRKLVETNPYISNCTVILDSTSRPIMQTPQWVTPEAVKKGESVVAFCLPVYVKEKVVGVLAADVPLKLLSKIVLDAQASPNSYSTLLGKDGSFLVHPDSTRLGMRSAFSDVDFTEKEATEAMISGETGYKHVEIQGKHYYVFYKPFVRSAVPGRYVEDLGWSIGMVYSEDDIFGDYNNLLYSVIIITVVGLLLLLVFCRIFIHRQLLPLRMLAKSAQRIAEGHYDETIPNSWHRDEVGRLQNHFQQMQQSLAVRVGEMEQLTETLEERGEMLQATYEQARAADRMKTNFLHNMTNQMMSPVNKICTNVKTIHQKFGELQEDTFDNLTDEILHRGEKITDLLNQLITDSEKKK